MQIDLENPKTIPRPDPDYIPHFASPPLHHWNSTTDEELNLLDYWRVIKKQKFKILLFTLTITLLTFVITSRMPKKYEAEVSLTPLSSSRGGGLASLISQASSLPIIGGQLGSLSGEKQQTQQFENILKSRTLIEGVIQDLHLMPVLFKEQWDFSKNNWKSNDSNQIPRVEDGVGILRSKVLKIGEEKKTGLIKIQVLFAEPQLAAEIANHFIVRLQDYITNNGLTVAKRNRQFVEVQLQKNKIDYLEFSKKLSEFYSSNPISSVQSKLDVDVGRVESLPKTFEEFRQELKVLEEKKQENLSSLAEVEQKRIVKNVPAQVYLQYLTLQRELLGRTNALLLQQYEMAKIEESKEDLMFQVIDKAIVPRGPSYPNVRLNTSIAFMGGLFFSVFWAFLIEYFRKLKEKGALK